MSNLIKRSLPALLVAGAALGVSAPAHAGTGCNGVVAWWIWGCAPWDNNNGPKFPYYKKQAVAVPAGTVRVEIKGDDAMATINGKQMPVIGGKAAIVAQGGGNIVAQGGGNIVAQGGGNLKVWSGQ